MFLYKFFSFLGIFLIFFLIWLISEKRKEFPFRVVIYGLILQFIVGIFVLNVPLGIDIFNYIGSKISEFLKLGTESLDFLFGNIGSTENHHTLMFGAQVALIISSTVIFFSSFVSVLYHFGIMQKLVYAMAWIMQKTMRTSGIESLSAASNVFLGQTEAPLLVRHYLAQSSRSEMHSIMVGGFATIAGGVMAAFIAMGIDASSLITASLISAPGGLMLSKIAIPPSKNTLTLKELKQLDIPKHQNALAALSQGAIDGMKLALNIIAMLIAFIALITLLDWIIGYISYLFNQIGVTFIPKTFKELIGLLFQPFAYLLGIPSSEASAFGSLFGTKISINEFIAYTDLAEMIKNNALSERTVRLATFALCGFANFSSIAIQIGGLGSLVPEKKSEIAQLGLKAMLIGALTNILTTMIAGVLI